MADPDPSQPGSLPQATRTADKLVKEYYAVADGAGGTVSINKYKIAGAYGGKAGAAQDKNIDDLFLKCQSKRTSPLSGPFGRAKAGKASADDFQHIFEQATKAGVDQGKLQGWADDNLGVDCTGFTVVHLSKLSLIDQRKYGGGVGCPWMFTQLKKVAQTKGMGSPLIWAIEDVRPNDIVMWMYDNSVETRTPGHISNVYEVSVGSLELKCAESSGEDDGNGHTGPRLKVRPWSGVKSAGGKKYVDLDGAQVIIARPYGYVG